MKLLFTAMKMEIGGAETHILEAARALHDRGVDVTVASGGGVYADELGKLGIRHIEVPLYSKKPWLLLRAWKILDKLLSEEEFDVIHAHARIPAVLSKYLAAKHHVRFITTAHLDFKVNGLLRRLTAWGEHTIAVSSDIKQYLISEYKVLSDSVTLTVNGIDTETYTPDLNPTALECEFSLQPGKKRILSVSRLDHDRSEAAFRLISAAPRLYEMFPDVEIWIVGDGNDAGRIRKEAGRVNKEAGCNLVRVVGARTDVRNFIAASDIFVNVSRSALEAMSMAKPVILAGNEGYLGIFREDKLPIAVDTNFCCRGCPPINSETLIADLIELLRMTPRERAVLGTANRNIVLEHFSAKRMADDYLAVYNTVRPFKKYDFGDVLICGYYGFGNIGDEAMLSAVIANLREKDPDVRLTVLSQCPRKTEKSYGVRAVRRFDPFAVLRAMKHAKLLVFGGGNLLQDASSKRSLWYYTAILKQAKRRGLKIMVYANGIGPLSKSGKRHTAKALALADRITLRENGSLTVCTEMGLPREKLRITADPAFTLRGADPLWVRRLLHEREIRTSSGYFVFVVRDRKENTESSLRSAAEACDDIRDIFGYTPIFLVMNKKADAEVTARIAAMCRKAPVILNDITPSETLGIMKNAAFVIGMRLHALVLASAAGTPSMAIAGDDKIRSFMELMTLPFTADQCDRMEVIRMAEKMVQNRDAISEGLSARHEEFAALAAKDAEEALELLRVKLLEEPAK